MLGASAAALVAAAGSVAVAGAGARGIDLGLLTTARLAFVLFWPAYAAGGLTALFGERFRPLKRRGRELGLAFAAVMPVHLGLIAWRCAIGDAPGWSTFVIFGIAVGWTALLVLFSFGRPILGKAGWWAVRVAGMNYIAFVFALDFLRDPFGGGIKHVVFYAPFAVLSVAGPALWLAAQAAAQSKPASRPAGVPSSAPSRIAT